MSPAEITTRQQRRRSIMDVLRPLSIGSAVIALGLALVNLAGWVLGADTLTSWIGGTGPENVSTSLVMPVIGTALLLIISILSGLVIFAAIQLVSRDRLEQKLRHDRDAESYQRKMVWELSRDMMVVANRDGYFVDLNPAWTRTLGWSREEIMSRPYLELVHPEDRGKTGLVEKQLSRGRQTIFLTNRYLCKDGSFRTLQWHSVVVDDMDEIFGVARDVTETVEATETLRNLNLELENRVRLRTRELETANGELESFSYAVSHDLRAPLRAIEGFSRMVVERHAGDLPDQGRHYLQRVRAASNRMAEIIDGLLDLSRLSRGDLKTDDVDLTKLAGEIVEDLQAADPDRAADLSIQPGMHTIGDRRLLTAMLQNLIANAWKFTSGKDHAVIEVGARQDAEHPYFYVRDNGAGFIQQHIDKLFKPFQRLHTIEEFEGTGLGLAIVQRVANRHGGAVWAEGEVGKGATFWFSLPVSESGHLPRSSTVTDFSDTVDSKQEANQGSELIEAGENADGR
ncbi:MAG TPA: ATP-binding protein [Thermoanaerobaculia bacterium]|nr:ATP-binding protein [Thermoanaerobaculia bacterium]